MNRQPQALRPHSGVFGRRNTGKKLNFHFAAGRDYPENLKDFKLIIHCGGSMINRPHTFTHGRSR